MLEAVILMLLPVYPDTNNVEYLNVRNNHMGKLIHHFSLDALILYPISRSILTTECLNYFDMLLYCCYTACPSVSLFTPPGVHSCLTNENCTGIQCCLPVDITVDVLYLNVWLAVDPCTYELSIGLGRWTYTKTLIRTDWGMENTVEITTDVLNIT